MHSLHIWRGRGQAPTPGGGEGIQGTRGVSQPLPGDPPQVQFGSGGPEAWESSDSGQEQVAGRGWLRKGRSPQREPAAGLKVSPSRVLCNGSRTHQPLLLRPISMLNCSLWPPGQGVRVSEPISAGEWTERDTERTPHPVLGRRLRPTGKW